MCALVETRDPLFWKSPSETSGPLDCQLSSSILGCLQLKFILAIVWEKRLVFRKLADIAAFSFSLGLLWVAMSLTVFLIYIFLAFLKGGGHVTQWWPSGYPLGGIWKKIKKRPFLLAWNPVVWPGHAGGYLSHITHEAASLWIKGQYASAGRKERERAWILAHFVEVLH